MRPARARFRRPALIYSFRPSMWKSCRIITPNLVRAYEQAFEAQGVKVQRFSLDPVDADAQRAGREAPLTALAHAIAEYAPDLLVTLDHLPCPSVLAGPLRAAFGTPAHSRPLLPAWLFHAYGDFSYYAHELLRTERELVGFPLRWVCASARQAELVSRLVAAPAGDGAAEPPSVCPFPVDPEVYSFSPERRALARTRLGLAEGNFALLYTGRFSLQKNSRRMLAEFSRFVQAGATDARLLLAGTFDDLGAPFFGVPGRRLRFAQEFLADLEGLPRLVRERVQFLGNLEAGELADLYGAADAWWSLSLHHDEDFGMSPAEGLLCGLPATLTDWGGYAAFAASSSDGEDARLIPVRLDATSLAIPGAGIQAGLAWARELPRDARTRGARAERASAWLSIPAVARKLDSLLREATFPEFSGFGWKMRLLGEAQALRRPFYPTGPRANTLYEEIHGAYLAPHDLPSAPAP